MPNIGGSRLAGGRLALSSAKSSSLRWASCGWIQQRLRPRHERSHYKSKLSARLALRVNDQEAGCETLRSQSNSRDAPAFFGISVFWMLPAPDLCNARR